MDFDSLDRFADTKQKTYRNTAEAQSLIKELAAQGAKIRAFVPIAFYSTTIEATQPGLPQLYVVVDCP